VDGWKNETAPETTGSPVTTTVTGLLLVVVDKGNHWLCQWKKRAYSEGRSRQNKSSSIE